MTRVSGGPVLFRTATILSAIAFVAMLAFSAARDAGWIGSRHARPVKVEDRR